MKIRNRLKNRSQNLNSNDKKIDFSKYAIFVDGVTSDPSKDYQCFIESV